MLMFHGLDVDSSILITPEVKGYKLPVQGFLVIRENFQCLSNLMCYNHLYCGPNNAINITALTLT
ncbi:hypothetical protein D3C78_1617300 [compost metagenome]